MAKAKALMALFKLYVILVEVTRTQWVKFGPWADIGLAPRYSTRVKVVTSWRDSLSYGDGIDAEMAPPAPAEMVLPDLEEWVTLLELDDAVGDETGDGDYVYPLATDFNTPNGGGLWDATHLTVRECLERPIYSHDERDDRYLGSCEWLQPSNRSDLRGPG